MSKTAGVIEQIQARLNALLTEAFQPLGARLQALEERLAALPPPMPGRDGRDGLRGEDGKDGKDGEAGFSLEDFSAETSEDGRTLTLRFQRGELKKEFNLKLRAMNYRMIWEQGTYQQDDVVTLGGSSWIAMRETTERPGTPGVDTGWKLMIKEGRPGKDGVLKPAPAHKVVRTA